MHRSARNTAVACAVLLFVAAAAPLAAEDPSVKKGLEEVGEAIKDGSVETYERAKEATGRGVGKALDKTGEGFDKAADGLHHAGDAVEEKTGN